MRKYLGASVIITVTALGSGDSDYGVRSFSGTTQIRNSRITGEDYTLAGDFLTLPYRSSLEGQCSLVRIHKVPSGAAATP